MTTLLKYAAILALVVTAVWLIELSIPKRQFFVDRVGEPAFVDYSARDTDGALHESVQVTSSSGLSVRFRVRRPAKAAHELPLLIVLGGHRTGKDAVDLVEVPTDMAYLAIDYPYTGEHKVHGLANWLRTIPLIQNAFLDTPPALSLALSWALQQPWVDAARVELVGVSLGVPFAATAGAVDARFTRVWLLHGGVDNRSWVAYAGREHIASDTLRSLAAGAALTLVHGNSFDTRRWIAATAPRPVVFIAACEDDYVPRESVESLLHSSADGHVEILWTSGLHISPRRPHELRQLLDTVTSRVAGRAAPPPVTCASDASAR